MKKKYELQYSYSARMVIEIDHSVFTPEVFREYSDFWSNKPDLEDWLVMVYMIVLRESICSISATDRLVRGEEEGFPKMDGSEGVRIEDFEGFYFDEFEVTFSEVKS